MIFLMYSYKKTCDKNIEIKTSETDRSDCIPSFRTIIVDECEYIFATPINKTRGFMAHKGNCKFCAERRKKEIASITKH